MASTKRKPAAPVIDDRHVELELGALRQRVIDEGAVKLSQIRPKALRDLLVSALVGQGFEASATWLRQPLRVQLERALAHGAVLPRKALSAQLRGASATELQRVLSEAEHAGRLRRVLRGKLEAVTGEAARVLAGQELTRLKAGISALDKALGQALRKKGLGVLASDVEQALEEAARGIRRPSAGAAARVTNGGSELEPASGKDPGGDPAFRAVLDALAVARDAGTGLSYVPEVVRGLLPAVPVAVARDMLLLAAQRELVELRPEGGFGRLTPEELELCPPGPSGTRLSWARLLEGGLG